MADHWYLHTDGRILRQRASTESDVTAFLTTARWLADTGDVRRTILMLREVARSVQDSMRSNSLVPEIEADRFQPIVDEIEIYLTDTQWDAMMSPDRVGQVANAALAVTETTATS